MATVNPNVEEKGENLFSFLSFRFAPYWPLFILLLLVGEIGAWLYMQQATPMYEANATMMIKDEKKGVDDTKMLDALNIFTTTKIVENEIEVLKSRSLMNLVVDTLHLYASVYEKGRLSDVNAYASSPITIHAKEPENLEPSDNIPFNYDKEKGLIHIDSLSYAVNTWSKTPFGELIFIVNGRPSEEGKSFYFKVENAVSKASQLATNLTAAPTNKISTVIDLTIRDESPQRAKDILNQLMKDYSNGTIDEKNSLAANTLKFIEARLGLMGKDIDSIEKTVQNYKSQQGIVDLSEEGKVFLKNVGDNDQQISNVNLQLSALDQVEKYVILKDKSAGLVPSTLGVKDEGLTRLLQKLYDAEIQRDKLKQTMGDNSPAVLSVTGEIASMRPAILENVRNQKMSLESNRRDLSSTNGKYSSVIRNIPQKERRLIEISRDQQIKNDVYSFLLQRKEETALSYSSTVADSRMIDPAMVSPNPVSPKRMYVFLGAFLLALFVGILIVVAKEFLPGKILFRTEIEKYTKVPIAVELTSVKHDSELIVNNPDKVFMSEQFRQLRASIGLYGKVVSRQKILITSSIAGEGKSFVAANLALSLSLSGKKVVLVDADFRSPKTSGIFELEDKAGFAEYLKGELDIKQLVIESSYKNLSIVPAGGPASNPTELLLNGKLDELFTYLSEKYDYVLVDTSPVAPVTDAYVLSEYCDKTLFVIRHGYTPKTMVKMLDENSKIKALANLYIVFNGVKKRGFIKGSYGFGYGFGYENVYKERRVQRTPKV